MYNTKTNNRHNVEFFPQIDRVLNEIFNTSINHIIDEKKINFSHPNANVRELKDRFVIDLAIPGLDKSDVKINVEKSILTISADKPEVEGQKFKLNEFKYGKFSRKFKLPETVVTDNITAELINGILSVTINKRKEDIDNGPKEINIL